MKYKLPDPLPSDNVTFGKLVQIVQRITECTNDPTVQYALALTFVGFQATNPTVLQALHDLGIKVIVFNKDIKP